MGLEQFYRGDSAFQRTADSFRELLGSNWEDWPGRSSLVLQCGNQVDIAVMIRAAAGPDHALAYLDKSIPALEGETPRACLQTDEGTKRLKVILTRAVGR